MKKMFSIIVPIYNVEKYLRSCLNSIKNQTFQDYEVIMIDDGSTDNSKKIAKEFENNQFKYFYKKNGGLSSARNFGIKKANGQYIMFIDSDDYIKTNALKKIYTHIQKYSNIDVIRYELCLVNEEHKLIEQYDFFGFNNKSINEALPIILKNTFVEPAPLYVINKDFYLKNNFSFAENRFHEDFGLIPIILLYAKSISSLNYCGYCYVQRNNSIMNNQDYNKTKQKVYDTLFHYDEMKRKAKNNINNITEETIKLFNSYIANGVISKIKILNKEDQKDFILKLKERKVVDMLLDNNLKRKMKKILYKIKFKLV